MSSESGRPILITGLHRTGTTWAGKLLASHPSVFYIHEPFHKRHAPGICPVRFSRWFQSINSQNEDRYGPAVKSTISLRFSLGAHILSTLNPKHDHFGSGLQGIGWALKEWCRWTRGRFKEARPLVKEPHALLSAEWLADRFDVQVVMLVRHPAGFVRSVCDLEWRHDFEELLSQNDLREGLLQNHVREMRAAVEAPGDLIDNATLLWKVMYDVVADYRDSHPNWSVVRMEDLAMQPVGRLSNLCEHLNIPFDETMRDAVEEYTNAEKPSGNGHDPYTVKRNSESQAWKWKGDLSDATVRRIQRQTAPVWKEFYDRDEWR